MLTLLAGIAGLIRWQLLLVEEEEARHEMALDLAWQFRNTGVDYEELRAHLDPTYWED